MRLTLRTLLAYMDGELERLYPQEAQEIGKKIEGSKFATDLFHKIRDVMRRLRLGAPLITERGANLDCNTVAEYLDNELPDNRVPDFEEVCLKSEMHLAEVASCHQILAVAQVEALEIDPASRERMYQLPAIAGRMDEERQAAVEAASVLSGDGHAPVVPPPQVKARPRPVVPEDLREPAKKRLLPAVAITFLACAFLCWWRSRLASRKPARPSETCSLGSTRKSAASTSRTTLPQRPSRPAARTLLPAQLPEVPVARRVPADRVPSRVRLHPGELRPRQTLTIYLLAIVLRLPPASREQVPTVCRILLCRKANRSRSPQTLHLPPLSSRPMAPGPSNLRQRPTTAIPWPVTVRGCQSLR